ncbi:MAG: leucine-rich repeat protein [Clostridia bacterium]|nr:leucine-rich repeat protein [Clostridia bacterium]
MFNLKKQHTVLALLLAFALCLQFAVPVLPVAAEEATYTSGTCGTGPEGAVVSWELVDDVLIISGKGGVTYNPFTAEQREYLIPRVKYLVIHNGIDTIGENAFKGFENLSSVSLSADLRRIDSYAFYGCSSLTEIKLPTGLTYIGMSAFAGCTALTAITVPSKVIYIGGTAFYGCTALKTVVLPDTLTTLGDAFTGCTALTEITVPEGVTSLYRRTFRNCTSLHTVYLPASLNKIELMVFDGCDALTDVYYNGVEEAWKRIKIEEDFNDPLFAAAVHFTVDTSTLFPDVKESDWFFPAVDFAYRNHLMVGNERGFEPNANLSRAMIAQILCNVEGPAATDRNHLFSDVSRKDWYGFAVDWAGFYGLISGQPDGTFAPNRNATREELISIIYRYAKFKKMDVSAAEDGTALAAFADADTVSSWAREAMQWACAEGILSGKPGKLIDPKGTATRAETAQIFKNLLG